MKKHTAVRFDPEILERADSLARRLSATGLEITRATVIRVALRRGLEAFAPEDVAAARAGSGKAA